MTLRASQINGNVAQGSQVFTHFNEILLSIPFVYAIKTNKVL
jgi:hypothetical protein